MKPVICQVSGNTNEGVHADCVRACVCSILEMTPDEVPHFFNGADAEQAHSQMREWLARLGYAAAYVVLPGDMSFEQVMSYQVDYYGSREALLFASNRSGNHCVITQNGKIAHDPAWIKSEIIGPVEAGIWILIFLVRM